MSPTTTMSVSSSTRFFLYPALSALSDETSGGKSSSPVVECFNNKVDPSFNRIHQGIPRATLRVYSSAGSGTQDLSVAVGWVGGWLRWAYLSTNALYVFMRSYIRFGVPMDERLTTFPPNLPACRIAR
eukprot:6981062-Pyramimonas_sp.AAC.1